MNRVLGSVVLALSGSGYPLTQLAIARLGRLGACVAAGVTGALLARDVALMATGTPGRLGPVPARLLWAETAAAAAATAAGIALLRDPGVAAARVRGWDVPPAELFRRLALGTLFGLHTVRFRVYLSPGSGGRAEQTAPQRESRTKGAS